MRRFTVVIAVLCFLASSWAFPVEAASQKITIFASADATVVEGSSENFGNVHDITSAYGEEYSTFLIKFDVAVIPADTEILEAKLTLHQTAASGDSITLNAYKVTSSWSESAVSGESRPSYETGVIYGALSVDSITGEKRYTQNFSDLVSLWAQDASQNYGLYFRAAESGEYEHEFGSRESVTKPKLEVTYTVSDSKSPRISGIRVDNISENSIQVSWNTDEPASGFVDYGKSTSYGSVVGGDDFVITHLVILPDLESDTEYHFRIRVKDEDGNESMSEDYTAKTNSADDTEESGEDEADQSDSGISPPMNVTAIDQQEDGNRYVLVSWDHSEELSISGYRIYRSAEDSLSYVLLTEVGPEELEYSDRDVEEGKTYFYVVRTVKDGEESSDSEEVVVTLYKNQLEKELDNFSFWKGFLIFNIIGLPIFGVLYWRYKKSHGTGKLSSSNKGQSKKK